MDVVWCGVDGRVQAKALSWQDKSFLAFGSNINVAWILENTST